MQSFLKKYLDFSFAFVDIFREIRYTLAMDIYEHVKAFTIKYCDADFKDEMKVSTALALFEEVACSSADELGFGQSYVRPRGYAFMVTNMYIEWLRPVRLGERVRVKTWPTIPKKVTFGREYQILSEDGETLVNATSRWCLFSMREGKLLQSKRIDNQDYSTYNTRTLFEDVRWKFPVFAREEGELRYRMTVAYSDYDHNFHVNNTKYADYCLNCFGIDELRELALKKFTVTYVKQCKEGEELSFYRKSLGNGEYGVQGYNGDGELVVQSYLYFEKVS